MYNVSSDELVKNSFYITYAFLMTTATITLIEALRTKNPKIRNILNLETCISVVAAFYYGKFVDDLEVDIDYEKINVTRYVDWSITTPIMLLVLILAFNFNNKKGPISFFNFLIILFFNYFMLGFGYLVEVGTLDKTTAKAFGFLGFFVLYYFIYRK